MNSIQTNTSAMLALQVLTANSETLAQTQNRISTGLKVSSAKDDGAKYAIAQETRARISSLDAVHDSLGRGKSLLDVTAAATQNISELLSQMKAKALSLNDPSLDTSSRSALMNDLQGLVKQIDTSVNSATFNGVNLMTPEVGAPLTLYTSSTYQTSIHYASTISAAPSMVTYNYAIHNALNYARDYIAADHNEASTASQADVEAYFNMLGYSTASADSYFSEIDGDSDGNLTQTERNAFFDAPSLSALDTDHNGTVSKSEFENWYTSSAGGTLAQADGVYAKMDTTSNGAVTSAERDAYYARAVTFPNPSSVVDANITMSGGDQLHENDDTVYAPTNGQDQIHFHSVSYTTAPGGYIGEGQNSNGTFNPVFDATTAVTPLSNPTPANYGIALDSVVVTPFVNYQVNLVTNADGAKFTLFKQPMTTHWLGLDNIASLSAQSLLQTVDSAIQGVSVYAEYFGTQQNAMDEMLSENSKLSDSLSSAVGNLVDADMGKESANLQAEQARQHLSNNVLSIANQQPDWILNLFK